MDIAVLGANGWLGGKVTKALNAKAITQKMLSEKVISEFLERENPEVLINCAGKTGRPNVDWCELNKLETFEANSLLPLNLARACEKAGARLVHFGSGCIFEGNNGGKGFSEEDKPNFFGSFYSRGKILGDELLSDFKNVLTLRLRMPVDSEPGPRNLITKLSGYKQIINEKNSITIIEDLLTALKALVEKNEKGIFNVVNSPATSHEEIISLYRKIVNPAFSCEFISLERLEKMTLAKRSNCILSTEKLENAGIKLRNTQEALADCLQRYKQFESQSRKP